MTWFELSIYAIIKTAGILVKQKYWALEILILLYEFIAAEILKINKVEAIIVFSEYIK
jgi:hypothetical protein